jgi:hypothetical protein
MNSLENVVHNLATQNQGDFTVTENGRAFISQRKLAELCGVDQSVISRFCASHKTDVSQGVTDENAILCITHYAIESKAANDTARKTLGMVAKAGMKAYIYHEAGYVMKAQKPLTRLEWIKLALEQEEALVKKEAEIAKLNTVIDNEFEYCSILRAARFLGVSEKVFNWRVLKRESEIMLGIPVKRVPSPRYGYQNLYHIQSFINCHPEYDFYGLVPENIDNVQTLALTMLPYGY